MTSVLSDVNKCISIVYIIEIPDDYRGVRVNSVHTVYILHVRSAKIKNKIQLILD